MPSYGIGWQSGTHRFSAAPLGPHAVSAQTLPAGQLAIESHAFGVSSQVRSVRTQN